MTKFCPAYDQKQGENTSFTGLVHLLRAHTLINTVLGLMCSEPVKGDRVLKKKNLVPDLQIVYKLQRVSFHSRGIFPTQKLKRTVTDDSMAITRGKVGRGVVKGKGDHIYGDGR